MLTRTPQDTPCIVPVALHYFPAHAFRSRAVIEYGHPLLIPPEALQRYRCGDEGGAQAELLELVGGRLDALMAATADEQEREERRILRRLYQRVPEVSSSEEYLELTRLVRRSHHLLVAQGDLGASCCQFEPRHRRHPRFQLPATYLPTPATTYLLTPPSLTSLTRHDLPHRPDIPPPRHSSVQADPRGRGQVRRTGVQDYKVSQSTDAGIEPTARHVRPSVRSALARPVRLAPRTDRSAGHAAGRHSRHLRGFVCRLPPQGERKALAQDQR